MEELLANKSRDLSWPTRIRLACDVAKGVKYLHSRNVMHRDLTSKVCLFVCLFVCLSTLSVPERLACLLPVCLLLLNNKCKNCSLYTLLTATDRKPQKS